MYTPVYMLMIKSVSVCQSAYQQRIFIEEYILGSFLIVA